MIKVNEKEYIVERFPDGSQRLSIDPSTSQVLIKWLYQEDGELFTVLSLAASYKSLGKKVSLDLPYLPNARMDRVKSDSEVFTLKIFCQLINQAGFEKVRVLDAHSNVSLALLDRVEAMDVGTIIKKSALSHLPDNTILYFPDEGSQKRYADLFPNSPYLFGIKKRDWNTGTITGLEIINPGINLKDACILMIDDIISFGGSLYYSALKLKELGAKQIFAYATHTENSLLDPHKGTLKKLLENGTVKQLFTTNSIFTKEHTKITVLEL